MKIDQSEISDGAYDDSTKTTIRGKCEQYLARAEKLKNYVSGGQKDKPVKDGESGSKDDDKDDDKDEMKKFKDKLSSNFNFYFNIFIISKKSF